MESFEIYFDGRPNRTYLCGETVSGHVDLKLKKEVRLKAIEIKFSGKSLVMWSETDYSLFCGFRTVTYYATEKYVGNTIFALGGQDKDDITLPPGEYTYNFALILPQELPSSYEGKNGHVRYTVKAKIVRPWKTNIETKQAYTVLNVMDLNALEHLLEPLTMSMEKNLCCLWCQSDPVTLTASLPVSGFVPGQPLQVLLEVDNRSTSDVSVKCNLVQKITYVASPLKATLCISSKPKKKESKKVVLTETLGVVDRLASKNFQSSMVMPSLPASFVNNCNSIYILYFLEFVGEFTGAHLAAVLEVPIVIGTIPLRNQFQSIQATDEKASSISADKEVYPNPSAVPGASYPDLPLPSYETCIYGSLNVKTGYFNKTQKTGDGYFTPRYPTYQFK